MNQLTDNALMLRVKDGDIDKMGLLFQRYHKSLYAFLYHMTSRRDASEDMVQTVFYRMLKYRHSFSGDGEFRSWMYHLARNVLYDSVKKNNHYHDDVHAMADQLGGGENPEVDFDRKQDAEMINRAMAGLSPEYREVLVLSRFQDLRYDEISEILNISESNVKVRVHRAMTELRKMFVKKPNLKGI